MISDDSRGSHLELFLGKGMLKICSKLTGEHPSRSNFIEITLRLVCFPVNLRHIFRIHLFLRTPLDGWLWT